MNASVSPLFRPSIIIFVGETGDTGNTGHAAGGTNSPGADKSVLQYFSELGATLDTTLCSGVGMLTVADGSDQATLHHLQVREDNPREDDFRVLFHELVRQVRSDRLQETIQDIGYDMPQPYPQIYIVGQTGVDWVAEVAKWVNEELGMSRPLSFIAYVLVDVPRYTGIFPSLTPGAGTSWFPPPWVRDLLPDKGNPACVNFCFMYEEANQGHTYSEPMDIYYAMAEALFVLAATGITAASTFREATALNVTTSDLDTRIGSLGSSLVHFPFDAVERYCSNMHAAELVRSRVILKYKAKPNERQQEKLRSRARERAKRDAELISEQIADDTSRPFTSQRYPHYWPDLTFMENKEQEVLQTRTEAIFEHFLSDPDREVRHNIRMAQAFKDFRVWRLNAVPQAWTEAERIFNERIERTINEVSQLDDSGEMAKIYTDQLDNALEQMLDSFMQLREEHQRRFEEDKQTLERISEGPWAIAPGEPALIGSGASQATPTLAGSVGASTGQTGPIGTPPVQTAPIGTPPVQPPPTPDPANAPQTTPKNLETISKNLETIAKNLERRATWMQSHVPTITGLFGLGAFAAPPFILLILNLLPPAWFMRPGNVLLVTLIVLVVLALLALGYRWFRQRRAREAEETHLDLYRIAFAYLCEKWEDQWRVVIIRPLLRKVRRIRQRLENMHNFVEAIAVQLEDAAKQAEKELFANPAAFRDVFVADGKLLDERMYTLNDVNRSIYVQRQEDPREVWHQTNEQINQHMNQYLAQHKLTLLNVGNEQVVLEHMRDFCKAIIQLYLRGELIDIGKALRTSSSQNNSIWQKAQRRAKILYLPRNEAPEVFFICAREDHRNLLPRNILPNDTTVVQTQSHAWMIVARFWTGGAGTRWGLGGPASTGPVVDDLPDKPDW